MISLVIITIFLILLFFILLFYIHSLYHVNSFVSYRNSAGIQTLPTDDVTRMLSFNEYYSLLKALYFDSL